jgi:catechol 2,3-dioxygenase-like lactoylglutathione lyase family enzyme
MKLTLHHINLSTENVDRMDMFYRTVLELEEPDDGLPTLEKKGYAAMWILFRTALSKHIWLKEMSMPGSEPDMR